MPFDSDKQPAPSGVVVTVEGMNVSLNVSLEEALRLKVLNSRQASHGVNVQGKGTTFNYTFIEVTRGAVAVDSPGMFEAWKRLHQKESPVPPTKVVITPTDSLNSTIILGADGTRLLTWDLSQATPAAQPSTEPTIVKGSDGQYPCDPACH